MVFISNFNRFLLKRENESLSDLEMHLKKKEFFKLLIVNARPW